MSELFVGLMSGTSMDGVDAALVDFSVNPPKLLASHTQAIPADIKQKLRALATPNQLDNEIDNLGEMDVALGKLFASATQQVLNKAKVTAKDVRAIGSHGQTIRHRPDLKNAFTIQIADPNIISELTGITTVADFRRRDMARGGQGAPLAPAYHEFLFRQDKVNRVILNLGGIANVTILPKDKKLLSTGFDTGPGNTLMDAWTRQCLQTNYDKGGAWANSGKVVTKLCNQLLEDPYFALAPPKTTGPEYFNLAWLTPFIEHENYKLEDVQASLLDLTASSIKLAVEQYAPKAGELIICGGGVHNHALLTLLAQKLNRYQILSCQDLGIDADNLEAMAFAWLAKQTLDHRPGNLPQVTGANAPVILGGIYMTGIWNDTPTTSNTSTSNTQAEKA